MVTQNRKMMVFGLLVVLSVVFAPRILRADTITIPASIAQYPDTLGVGTDSDDVPYRNNCTPEHNGALEVKNSAGEQTGSCFALFAIPLPSGTTINSVVAHYVGFRDPGTCTNNNDEEAGCRMRNNFEMWMISRNLDGNIEFILPEGGSAHGSGGPGHHSLDLKSGFAPELKVPVTTLSPKKFYSIRVGFGHLLQLYGLVINYTPPVAPPPKPVKSPFPPPKGK